MLTSWPDEVLQMWTHLSKEPLQNSQNKLIVVKIEETLNHDFIYKLTGAADFSEAAQNLDIRAFIVEES